MGMVVPIVMLVSIFLLFVAIGVVYFVYWFINNSRNNMNVDTKTKALDVFVYLGIGITLVTSVFNLLQILFTAIDRKFADVLNVSYVDIYNSDIRLAVSFLVVMYPIYLVLSWYVSKDIEKFLYKRDIAVRKIMIYAMIFITVCTLIGTLVSAIYTYLGGELTASFAYKAISVFLVSLSVFGYYFYAAKRDYTKKTFVPLIVTVSVSLVVIASLIWSINIVGTPSAMRAKRLDSTRLSDLSSIQQQVLNKLNGNDKLPINLSDLNDAFLGYSIPLDPVTKESYVYRVIEQPVIRLNYTTQKKEMVSNATFEICANFQTVRDTNQQNGTSAIKTGLMPADISYSASNYYYEGDTSPFWNHGIGETCFKRVVTTDMYYGK